MLMQARHPIAFISKSLFPKQLGLSIYEKEMYAVLYAIEKWGHYLSGRHFKIQTNHQSLQFLLQQKIRNPNQHT